jgi:hypothetical protein
MKSKASFVNSLVLVSSGKAKLMKTTPLGERSVTFTDTST